MNRRPTPAQAWAELMAGNTRFVDGRMEHPSQGVDRRAEVSTEQHPFAVLFGCSDSRVAAEIIFDRGLGDMFVVRTAGHVVDTTVLGSIEYGVDILGAPLVVVLGHDHCGAVGAASHALATGELPSGFVRAIVDRVIPSLVTRSDPSWSLSDFFHDDSRTMRIPDADELRREHVRATVRMLQSYSASLAEAVRQGRCAIVGVEYTLADGRASVVETIGKI
ncbi:carbonic anhydrase [Occultella glacieicola]|uniref:carbonic anhydrase n=1 Tax=Occultella glacieicola TaxID=2518684 RepID=A0ABY2E2T3_9MICO|nr:carbonic anhydrase [Occultella glacieicola]TDE93926.1 carbonic anhydrase [Occultella glacieicola]